MIALFRFVNSVVALRRYRFVFRALLVVPMVMVLPAALLGSTAMAEDAAAPLLISNAWVRAMPPGRKMTAAYMHLQNQRAEPVLIQGVTADQGDASLHETTTVDGQSRMRSLPQLRIEPGEAVVLEPGGRHIMLMGLGVTPAIGDTFDLCILFDTGEQCISAPVQRSSSGNKR